MTAGQPNGRLDPWRADAGLSEEQARELARLIELRGRSEDEVATRNAYLDLLGIRPGERVLEVGCGSGVVTRELARRVAPGGRVTALDANSTFLEVARDLAEAEGLGGAIEFRQGDVHALPLADATFDAVLAVTVLEHIPDAERVVPELVRVAAPGGRVGVVTADTETFIVAHPDRGLTRRVVAASTDVRFANPWIGRRLPGLFEAAGLGRVEVRAFTTLGRDPAGFYGKAAEVRATMALRAGGITAEEHDRWLGALRAEQDARRFLAGTVYLFVRGRRPG